MQTTAPISNVTLTPQSPASALADAWAASLPHTICEGRFRIEAAAFDVLRPQLVRAYRTHLQGISREDASEFNERLDHYERTCFGAVLRDEAEPFEIVGSLLLEASEPGTLYIRWMNLLPRAQANGIPEALLRHLLRFARSAGFRRVEADIQFQNSNFLKVLSGRGFTVAGIQLSERWGSTVRLSRSIAPSSGSIPSRKEEQHHEEESQEVCSVQPLIKQRSNEDLPERLKAHIELRCSTWLSEIEFFRRIETGTLSVREIFNYLLSLRALILSTPCHLQLAEQQAERAGKTEIVAFLRQKLEEERDHHLWADHDLAGLRARFPDTVTGSSPSFSAINKFIGEISALAAKDLSGYLAYLLLAELSTVLVGGRSLALIQTSLGISSSQLSVIQKHIELDQNHSDEDLRALVNFIGEATFEDLAAVIDRFDRLFRTWMDEVTHDAT